MVVVSLRKRTVNAFLAAGPEHDPSASSAIPPPAKRAKRALPKHRPVTTTTAATAARNNSEKLKFTDLPVEVVIQVFVAAEYPNEMQSLASTCKALHAVFRTNHQYIFNLSTASSLSTKLAIAQCFLGAESPSFLYRVKEICDMGIASARRDHVPMKALFLKCRRNEKVISEFAAMLYRWNQPPWYNLGRIQPWTEERMRNALNRLWALQVLFFDRDGEYFGDMVTRSQPASWELRNDPKLADFWAESRNYVYKIMDCSLGGELSSYPPAVRTILEFYIENFLLDGSDKNENFQVQDAMGDVEALISSIFIGFSEGRKYAYVNSRQFSIGGGSVSSKITCGMILLNGGLARLLQVFKLDTDTLVDNIAFCVTPYDGKIDRLFFKYAFGYLYDLVFNVMKEKEKIRNIMDDITTAEKKGSSQMDVDVQMGDA